MDFQTAHIPPPSTQAKPPELVQLESLRGGDLGEEIDLGGGKGLRVKALRQEAMRSGAQSGLAWRYGLIMRYLNKNEPEMNVVFNFAGFVNDGRVLIPCVLKTPNLFINDEEKGEVREVKEQITIATEAKLISVVPTWRDYLWQEYSYPEPPHHSLRPRTDAEVKAWEDGVKEGWSAGVSQADMIYSDRLAALEKDVACRNTYKVLVDNGAISPAALKVVNNQVTFNGRSMNVGEVIYTISGSANYKQASEWKPIWTR